MAMDSAGKRLVASRTSPRSTPIRCAESSMCSSDREPASPVVSAQAIRSGRTGHRCGTRRSPADFRFGSDMTAAARLAGGVLVLIVYAWVLAPVPTSVSSPDTRSDADVERWLARSNETFTAKRYTEALEPTTRLVERFPLQQAYAERLAHIFGALNRAADEAAAWE